MRMLKLAEFLDRNGWRVHIVAGAGPRIDDFGYSALLSRLSITYVPDRALRAPPHQEGQAPPAQSRGSWKHRLVRMAKAVILELCTPDVGVLSLGRISRTAEALVKRHEIRHVITSGPPHSDHLVGLRLKKRHPRLKWIVDYRDSWNSTLLFRKKFLPLQWLNEELERRVLKHCDALTYVSEPMLTKLLARHAASFRLDQKAHLVRNGFDEDMLARTHAAPPAMSESGGMVVLGYFGAISDEPGSYRDPSSLLRVLEAHPDLPVRLEFYGSTRINPEWKRRLGDRLHIGGALSHPDAVAKMAAVHGLMLLHTERKGADEVVTGKVFEYIASGRIILSVGPAEMAVNGILRNDSLSLFASHEKDEELESALRALVDMCGSGGVVTRARDEMLKYTRQTQYQHFLEILK
jgi:glycosyltransferase involved in cell wall biosynthesis